MSSKKKLRMTSSTVKPVALLVAACLLSAPAWADFASEKARLQAAPAKDAVLYTLQAGLAAMGEGQREAAGQLFDQALVSIEGMFANTENAAKARSLWYEEGAKDYKGEPYERAMAFYYRGLLYLADGDYENARASFRGGILQDAFAEEDQHRADFASLVLLEGWANQLNGDAGQAREAYQEVSRLRPGWRGFAPDANVLVIAELGGAPRKLGDGIGNDEIVYRKAKRMPERSLNLALDGKPVQMDLVEDLFYQAATRGGRPIDRVIAGKVAFKEAAGAVGDVFGTIASEGAVWSAAVGQSNGNALGAVAAVGAIASIISIKVKPKADVRYWNNLPETLHVNAVRADQLPQAVAATLIDSEGKPVPLEHIKIQRWLDKNGNGLVWIKTRN